MMIPAFWWEVNAFQNSVMAFNNVLSDPEMLQQATPAQLYWGIFEAEMLYSYSGIPEAPEFDREPLLYVAAALHHTGLIYAPDVLTFAQEELDKLNRGKKILSSSEVKSAWTKVRRRPIESLEFDENKPLDVQLSRLAALQLYINDRTDRYQQDISSFTE